MKRCSNIKCTQVNPQSLTEFHKNKARKDGLQHRCNTCRFHSQVEYRQTPEGKASKVRGAKKYRESPKGKAWQESSEAKAHHREYQKRPEEKAAQRIRIKEYRQTANGRAKYNAIAARYRAKKLQGTPAWLTKEHHKENESFYLEAVRITKETGILYHVDHIVPLQGEDVSGLHVPWNLQVLPAYGPNGNISKGNR